MKLPILISAISFGLVYAQEQATDVVAPAEPQAEVQQVAPTADSTLNANSAADSAKVDTQANLLPPEPQMEDGTELKGALHGFLKAEHSPYLVTEDIVVEPNTALIVEPGVEFLFAPGTGFYAKGQFVVAGTRNNEVEFRSAMKMPKSGDWKGIFITGEMPSEIRNAIVREAETGIVVENGELNIQSSKIEKTSSRGVYAKNSKLSVNSTQFFQNQGAALHIDSYSRAEVNDAKFEGNNVALYNAPLAITSVSGSSFTGNTYGILNMGNSHIAFNNTKVNKNTVGASSEDVLGKEVLESISNNETDYNKDFSAVAMALPSNPEIPGVKSRPVDKDDYIGDLLAQKINEEQKADTTQKSWNITGNIGIGNYYHYVKTSKNDTKVTQEISGDSIKPGDRYENTFQVPGFGTDVSIYVLMQSPDGKTIELNTEYTGDSWNRFNPKPVTLTYTDKHNRLILGDFSKNGGEIYMSSLPIFGIGYTRSLLTNNANQPLFELDGFFGESRKPYLIDDRHPYVYKNYIEDGEAQAQRIAYGGSVKWAPLRRFDAKFGFIYANDEIHDPLLRDGGSRSTITSEPMQQALSLYADGNWLFYPGDIELNGQIAVGRADTADVIKERAINKVFTEAGLNTSSMNTLRKLMANESKINTLTSDELDEIFGSNTTLSRPKMRDSLRTLIREAKAQKNDYESDRDDDRVLGLNWGSQNIAIGASLYWNIYKTTLSGHIKYVGEDYYSAGSPDQLSDTREFGGYLEQIITDFWTFGFGYQINVENAAKGNETNLFGLGEGSHWGLFSEDEDWMDEHELDNDRAKYIQNFTVNNGFKIGAKMNLNLSYNLEYRTQYRPYQLHGDYILEDEIYKDRWFAKRSGKETSTISTDEGNVEVDAERWAEYQGMASADYLASKFQERIYKNTWMAEFSINAYKTNFKVAGRWTLRSDDSKFHKDSLISKMDLSNETLAKLGYYFGGADYFEHAYPISATTSAGTFQNRIVVTPRFKNYERDNMTESEISVNEEFEIPFMDRFLVLGLSGEFRYLTASWEEEDEDAEEKETDILGNVCLTVNHTKRLSSEWYAGTGLYFRPDNLSNEYKDIYGGIRVNYAF